MTIDERILSEAYDKAGVPDHGSIAVAGRTISRLGLVGVIQADGQNILELDPEEQVKILNSLRRAAKDAVPEHLDPARNPMIRTSYD